LYGCLFHRQGISMDRVSYNSSSVIYLLMVIFDHGVKQGFVDGPHPLHSSTQQIRQVTPYIIIRPPGLATLCQRIRKIQRFPKHHHDILKGSQSPFLLRQDLWHPYYSTITIRNFYLSDTYRNEAWERLGEQAWIDPYPSVIVQFPI
jgi:hypothetical protein